MLTCQILSSNNLLIKSTCSIVWVHSVDSLQSFRLINLSIELNGVLGSPILFVLDSILPFTAIIIIILFSLGVLGFGVFIFIMVISC